LIAPTVVVVTALETVPEPELFARLDAVAPHAAGALVVQVRDHALAQALRRAFARRLRAKTAELGARLLIGVDVELALEIGADGVHLPGRIADEVDAVRARFEAAGRRATVSVACHSLDDVLAAARRGADLALLSPIFASPGKGTPLGIGAISDAHRALEGGHPSRFGASPTALIALGGVDEANARACLDFGADGVAAIRATPARLFSALDARA